MKVYELILLVYSLFVIVWCVCGIRKEDKWFHWFFEYGFIKYMIRVISCVFMIIILSCFIISKIDWSFLTVAVW